VRARLREVRAGTGVGARGFTAEEVVRKFSISELVVPC